MKRYDTDDELDSALFALPLEEPPSGLHQAILARTIYRPTLSVKPWEVWALGGLCAVLTWLLVLVATGGATTTVAAIESEFSGLLALLATPQLLFWIAIGGGAALWISQLNLTVAPEALRAGRR